MEEAKGTDVNSSRRDSGKRGMVGAWDVTEEKGCSVTPLSEEVKLDMEKGMSNCHALVGGNGLITVRTYVTSFHS